MNLKNSKSRLAIFEPIIQTKNKLNLFNLQSFLIIIGKFWKIIF